MASGYDPNLVSSLCQPLYFMHYSGADHTLTAVCLIKCREFSQLIKQARSVN